MEAQRVTPMAPANSLLTVQETKLTSARRGSSGSCFFFFLCVSTDLVPSPWLAVFCTTNRSLGAEQPAATFPGPRIVGRRTSQVLFSRKLPRSLCPRGSRGITSERPPSIQDIGCHLNRHRQQVSLVPRSRRRRSLILTLGHSESHTFVFDETGPRATLPRSHLTGLFQWH